MFVEDILSPPNSLEAIQAEYAKINTPSPLQTPEQYAANPLDLQNWSDLTLVAGLQNAASAMNNLMWVVQAHVSFCLFFVVHRSAVRLKCF